MTVIINRWKCCGKKIRSQFCPSCGRKRDDDNPLTRARVLLQEFDDQAAQEAKTAETYQAKADEIKLECNLDEVVERDLENPSFGGMFQGTWRELVYRREQAARAFRKKSLTTKSWANVIRDLLEEFRKEAG